MEQPFETMLAVGGKSNSLGLVDEVVATVLGDKLRIDELYACLSANDAWVRMRAADALEKVCRVQPDWLEPYINKCLAELASSGQASILWHLAQIFRQVALSPSQLTAVIQWLHQVLSSPGIDWIVAANSMETLAVLARRGDVPAAEAVGLLAVQQQHKSPAVIKRSAKLLAEFEGQP